MTLFSKQRCGSRSWKRKRRKLEAAKAVKILWKRKHLL